MYPELVYKGTLVPPTAVCQLIFYDVTSGHNPPIRATDPMLL